jgi:Family of unknown function (DUF6499)
MPNKNWRSSVIADELYKLERTGFAWEYLRRNRIYRNDFAVLRRGRSTAEGKAAATRLAIWGLSFRVRPVSSGRPGTDHVAAGVHTDSRHHRAVATRISQHRQT